MSTNFTEGYLNFSSKKEMKDNNKLTPQLKLALWNMIQKAYSRMGGYAGEKNFEELVANSDQIKIYTKDGIPKVIASFKFLRGKKLNLVATDGSRDGILALTKIILDQYKFSNLWSEISGPAIALFKRAFGKDFEKLIVDGILAKHLTGKNIESVYSDKSYDRQIGDKIYNKIIVGNPEFSEEIYAEVLNDILDSAHKKHGDAFSH